MSLSTWRGLAALVVVAAAAVTWTSRADTAGALASQVDRPTPDASAATPPAGVGLSPEVAAVPASSPALDAALAELRGLEADRDRQREDLDADSAELVTTSADLEALTVLVGRRASQVHKAEAVAERSRAALSELTIERFVSGDHLLEGLDPFLTWDRRTDLARQAVLGEVGTDQVLREHRYAQARLAALRSDLDDLRTRASGLQERSGELVERTASLQASLAALEPRIASAQTAADAARRTADIDGTDMSAVALDAYWRAERYLAFVRPTCGLTWPILAGIGRTESHHGTYQGAALAPDGVVSPPIYGPDLDGSNRFAVVQDSDGGALDATSRTDRAVGPMQFLPGTWRTVGTDMTGDGTADPQNLFDAAAAAGVYLCRSGPGLDDPARLRSAVLTYNRSQSYADLVTQRASEYAAAVPLR